MDNKPWEVNQPINSDILKGVYRLATEESDGLTIGFMPNDPRLLSKVSVYKQYSLAFEMVNELTIALEAMGMNVNPFMNDLLLNIITMVSDQSTWTATDCRLEMIFTNRKTTIIRAIDVKITFTCNGLNLFTCSHNFAMKRND